MKIKRVGNILLFIIILSNIFTQLYQPGFVTGLAVTQWLIVKVVKALQQVLIDVLIAAVRHITHGSPLLIIIC